MNHLNSFKVIIAAGAFALSASVSTAAPITWANWSSNTAATLGSGLSLTYSGELSGLATNFPSWTPTATWADGSIINNAPPASGNSVVLVGGATRQNTITFSQAVVNPVMAIWSLGQSGVNANFTFFGNATPTFVAGGPSADFLFAGSPAGSPISVADYVVSGNEGNGSVIFYGTFNSISWQNPLAESFYGFTVGITRAAVVPVPAAAWLLGSGLVGLMAFSRRKKAFA